jgi:hypothetical protein
MIEAGPSPDASAVGRRLALPPCPLRPPRGPRPERAGHSRSISRIIVG